MVDMSSIKGHGTLGEGDDLPAQGAFTHSVELTVRFFKKKLASGE